MWKEGKGPLGFFAIAMLVWGCGTPGTISWQPATAPMADPPELVGSDTASEETGKEEPSSGTFRLSWASRTHSWNRIVALTPSGDVISVGSGRLHIHARDTGEILESTEVCSVRSRRALAFVAPSLAVLACTDGVIEVSLPGLATHMVFKTDGLSVAAAASKNYIAHALRGGTVQVLERRTRVGTSHAQYVLADRFPAGNEIEELAFSPDGKHLAIGLRDGRVALREIGREGLRELDRGQQRATGLAFSHDGRWLFVNNELFGARVLSLEDGTIEQQFQAGSWISAASPLGQGSFATAGSDGLLVYSNHSFKGSKIEFDAASCEGLDVSEDGSVVCTGDRQGLIACFANRPLLPSTYRPAVRGDAVERSTPSRHIAEGTIADRSAHTLRVRLNQDVPVPPSGKGRLYRRFDSKIGAVTASGWLFVGRVEFRKGTGNTVEVVVKSEESSIRVDGSQVDAFHPGMVVKLEWSGAMSDPSKGRGGIRP